MYMERETALISVISLDELISLQRAALQCFPD
jgi:hypothetical protein